MVIGAKDFIPHETHQMTVWVDTLMNGRFASVRYCTGCGGEHYELGGAGSSNVIGPLDLPCGVYAEKEYILAKIEKHEKILNNLKEILEKLDA